MRLLTTVNIERADDIYEELIALHHGRSEDESMALNARLILLLINHVGDYEVVREAINRAAARPKQEDI